MVFVDPFHSKSVLGLLFASRKMGHSASLWKDYYLDHRERIDGWISMCLEKEKEEKEKLKESKTGQKSMPTEVERVKHSYPAIKKPSPASFKQETLSSSFWAPYHLSSSSKTWSSSEDSVVYALNATHSP